MRHCLENLVAASANAPSLWQHLRGPGPRGPNFAVHQGGRDEGFALCCVDAELEERRSVLGELRVLRAFVESARKTTALENLIMGRWCRMTRDVCIFLTLI